MSDEQNLDQDTIGSGAPEKVTNVSLVKSVAAEIAAAGPRIHQNVVNILADAEINKRTDILMKGLDAIKKSSGELGKLSKPDFKTIEVIDGVETPKEVWTPEARKKFNEGSQKHQKLVDTFNKALEKNDNDSYAKLSELIK